MDVREQKTQAFIALLKSMGVFDVRSGSVQLTINFDGNGVIGSVEMTTKKHYRV